MALLIACAAAGVVSAYKIPQTAGVQPDLKISFNLGRQIKENISCYLGNAKAVADGLESVGIRCFGGRNSPYIWFEVPNGLTSWQMFDRLLSSAQVIGTPGSGFGRMGEGYFRLTAFAEPERTLEAVKRIKNGLG